MDCAVCVCLLFGGAREGKKRDCQEEDKYFGGGEGGLHSAKVRGV